MFVYQIFRYALHASYLRKYDEHWADANVSWVTDFGCSGRALQPLVVHVNWRNCACFCTSCSREETGLWALQIEPVEKVIHSIIIVSSSRTISRHSRCEFCTIMIKHIHATCTERDQLTRTYIKLRVCVSLDIKTYVFISLFSSIFVCWRNDEVFLALAFLSLLSYVPIYNFFYSPSSSSLSCRFTRCRCRRNRKYVIRRNENSNARTRPSKRRLSRFLRTQRCGCVACNEPNWLLYELSSPWRRYKGRRDTTRRHVGQRISIPHALDYSDENYAGHKRTVHTKFRLLVFTSYRFVTPNKRL